jgi:hypothetical protein
VIQHGQSVNPLPDDQPCWSGTHDWEPALLDLSEFQGQTAHLRFHFGSDSTVQKKGWWIDDIEIRMPAVEESPYDLAGEILGRGAQLAWHTPDLYRDDGVEPTVLEGYRIYRNGDLLDTLATDNNFFNDLVGLPRGNYEYMVSAQYNTGESSFTNWLTLFWPAAVGDAAEPAPSGWELTAVWPNPFNLRAQVAYHVPVAGLATLAVYDVGGRRVRVLAEGRQESGQHTLVFDAVGLPSGIYIVRLESPVAVRTAKLALVR